MPSESVGLGADDVSSILDISGAYDSGWIQGGGPVNDWSAAWTYLGRTAPAFSTSAPADVIISAPPGQRIYGARLYNMFYFGSFDANP